MAEGESKIGEILDHKYGPLTLKMWGLGLAGIGGLYYLYKKQHSASTSSSQPVVVSPNPSLAASGGGGSVGSQGVSSSDPVIQGLLSDLQTEQAALQSIGTSVSALTGQVSTLQTQAAAQPPAPSQITQTLPLPSSYPTYSPLPIASYQPQAQASNLPYQGVAGEEQYVAQLNAQQAQANALQQQQQQQQQQIPQQQQLQYINTPVYSGPSYQNYQLPSVTQPIYNQPTPNYQVQNGYVAMGPVYQPTGQPAYYTKNGQNYAPVQQPGQIGFGPP